MKLRALVVLALTLGACGGDDDTKAKAPPPPEGRPETRAIRNTQVVGVPGKDIANKLDDALNKAEQHDKDTEKKAEEETQ